MSGFGPSAHIQRLKNRREQQRKDPYALMFRQQREAFADEGQEFIAAHCGRRSGKTRGFLLRALKVMQRYPGCRIPYIALTRMSAEGILWDQIRIVNDELDREALAILSRGGTRLVALRSAGFNHVDHDFHA